MHESCMDVFDRLMQCFCKKSHGVYKLSVCFSKNLNKKLSVTQKSCRHDKNIRYLFYTYFKKLSFSSFIFSASFALIFINLCTRLRFSVWNGALLVIIVDAFGLDRRNWRKSWRPSNTCRNASSAEIFSILRYQTAWIQKKWEWSWTYVFQNTHHLS